MNTGVITAVGIDVSKYKSTLAARRPGGEVALFPFDISHDVKGIKNLLERLHSLSNEGSEIRVIMEHTGMYRRHVALALQQAGFFVSVVNAILIHNFSDNSLRKVKTDKADVLKIANYGLTFWMDLRKYSAEDQTRQMLKIQNWLYERTTATGMMLRNGLISLLDQTLPRVNKLFLNEGRNAKGNVKWLDL